MTMEEERKLSPYEELSGYLEQAMAYRTALTLFEWDNETLAPKEAGRCTAGVQGTLSAAYQRIMTEERVKALIDRCDRLCEPDDEIRRAVIREAREESEQLS